MYFATDVKKHTIPLFVLFFGAGFLVLVFGIRASFTQNTIGWIWGGMDATGGGTTTLGWISLNSRDCDTDGNGTVTGAEQVTHPGCPPGAIIDYGVNVPEVSGDLSGYAWSENYGWISFEPGDMAGCPSGTCSARRAVNSLAGWGRILSIRDGGAGWNGWLKLGSDGSDAVSYGVTLSGRDMSGYAYSDELGWIDFSSAKILPNDFLQLCVDGVPFMIQGDAPKGFTMSNGATVSIQTYYDNTNDCLGTPVTGATTFVESAGNPNAAVITLSANGPSGRVATGNINTVPSGKDIGTETVAATYNSLTLTINFRVEEVCSSNCPVAEATTCIGTSYHVNNSCQQDEVCGGTRACDYNYKEVAP